MPIEFGICGNAVTKYLRSSSGAYPSLGTEYIRKNPHLVEIGHTPPVFFAVAPLLQQETPLLFDYQQL
jgi:hypothetical protein